VRRWEREHVEAGTSPTDRPTNRAMPNFAPSNDLTLSAMITPAQFMTANGSLIISTSNRMSRIVGRIRVLNEQIDVLGRNASELDFPAERRAHIDAELSRLAWWANRIRAAPTLLYLAFNASVGTSLTLAIDVLLANRLAAVPTELAIVGVTSCWRPAATRSAEPVPRCAATGSRSPSIEKLQKLRKSIEAEPS
jgi:hypothetical protein